MRSGKLRMRVSLERPEATDDAYGQEYAPEPWPVIGTYWAEVLTERALERIVGQAPRAEATSGIKLRGRIDVRPDDRLRFNGRLLYIDQVVNPDNRGIELVVICKERQSP